MKHVLFSLLTVLFSVSMTYGQSKVSGKVTDVAGEPLIGASVVVKEVPTAGTITDVDGMYELNVPAGGTILVISYTGYETKEMAIGGASVLNVALSEGKLLDEVVVTALGIKRNSREVAYANQKVSSEELLSLPNKNALEALRGKTAGVKITTASGSVGASSRIVLRGESSLTGNNNALIVIDGIPIDNEATSGGSGTAQSGYADFGNRFNDINPEDIESVTVLKGPAATSVYGSRGAAGVVLVTTKKGGDGAKTNFKVGINSSYSREKAYVLLQRQDKFGQGYDNAHFDSGENWSWGPAFDGIVRPWTSPIDIDGDGALEALVRPYSAVPNQIENFFNIGTTLNNNIFMSGSNGGFSFYASYGNLAQEGILENTSYNRNTINLKASSNLSKKLTADFGVNFSRSKINTAQEGYRPFDGQNAYANAIQAPVNIPYNELRDYNNPYHSFTGYYGSYSTNPYYILNEFTNAGNFDNLLTNVGLTYKLFKNFVLTGRVGINSISGQTETSVPVFGYTDHIIWGDDLVQSSRGGRFTSAGEYAKSNIRNTNTDVSLIGTYSTNINDDFNLEVSGGYNLFDRRESRISGQSVGGLVVPGWYNFNNSSQTPRSSEFASKYQLYGILGTAKIGYQNKAFLEYSARNDWSSTLPADNNSFFYQSVGASVIMSDFLNLDENGLFSFWKLRGSFGTTGKDASLYLLASTYDGNPTIQTLGNNHDIFFPLNGQSGFSVNNRIGNPNLRPELTRTFEIGTDLGFWDNRVNVEYTYYSSVHSDQIITVNLPASTGFGLTSANIGEMTNKGHELALKLTPVLTKDFQWNVNVVYSKNTNKVVKISDTQDELVVGGPYTNGSISIVAKEGLPFGTFRSTVPVMVDGKMLVDDSGIPVLTSDEKYLGSYQPKYLASFGTDFTYKGIRLGGLLDIKKGGTFLSVTKNQTEFNGTALSTLIGNREPFVIENSVVENADGTYSPNTTEVTAQELYAVSDVYFGGNSLLLDASFIKLRELTLGYTFPKSLLSKTPFSQLNVDFYASNLKFWLPEENTYADPEINGPSLTGNATGVETTQTPPARSYGVKLGIIF